MGEPPNKKGKPSPAYEDSDDGIDLSAIRASLEESVGEIDRETTGRRADSVPPPQPFRPLAPTPISPQNRPVRSLSLNHIMEPPNIKRPIPSLISDRSARSSSLTDYPESTLSFSYPADGSLSDANYFPPGRMINSTTSNPEMATLSGSVSRLDPPPPPPSTPRRDSETDMIDSNIVNNLVDSEKEIASPSKLEPGQQPLPIRPTLGELPTSPAADPESKP